MGPKKDFVAVCYDMYIINVTMQTLYLIPNKPYCWVNKSTQNHFESQLELRFDQNITFALRI